MLKRLAFLAGVGLLSVAALMPGALATRPADAAAQISNLTFSTAMTPDFQPSGEVGIEFSGDNNGVYVTFSYSELPANASLGRIVRVNQGDYNWDEKPFPALACCPQGGNGRYGFPVTKRDGEVGDLPGGAYEVRIYLNGVDVQHGGFGIRGEGGLDNENGGNGNDN